MKILVKALNKLIWKLHPPTHLKLDLNEFAEYILGELRDGPDADRIERIKWNAENSEFEL